MCKKVAADCPLSQRFFTLIFHLKLTEHMKNALFTTLSLLFFSAQMMGQTSLPTGLFLGKFKQINASNGNRVGQHKVNITAKKFTEGKTVGTVTYSAGCSANLIYKMNDGQGTFIFEEELIKNNDEGCECDGEVKIRQERGGELSFTHVVGDMMVQGPLKKSISQSGATTATKKSKN